ncbi:MAG TPA: EAL domain-containing protein [Usitatibacter sp.]|nr:EAL domain-containing protein [Usitatibacter sp.]
MAARVLLAGLLLAALAPAAEPAAAPPERLVVVTDDHYPPYLFRDGKGRLQGIVADKWELWSERTGVPVEVRGKSWVGAQASVRDGEADVVDLLTYAPPRAGAFEFSRDSERTQARVYFDRSLGGITSDASSLRGFVVGAKAGGACAEWMRDRGVEDIRAYPDSESLVAAAGAGHVKLFCMDEQVADYFLYRQGLSGKFRQTQPLYSAYLHWAVRAGNAPLRDFVQAGFDRIPRGDLEAIDTKWFGNPLRSAIDLRLLYALGMVPIALVALSAALMLWNRGLRLRLEARARYFSTRDPLTELPARALLHDRLAQELARADRTGGIVAVLFVDLDRFKAVNNTFGHAWGDRVLRETASRLQRCVGGADTVGRISSDEFVIVLSDLARADEAGAFARRVLAELHRPYAVDGQSVYCTASIGIAVHPGDGSTASTLIQNADIAMYRAKERGRNGFQFFLPEMHQRAVRRLRIETALRGALEREEFLLQYQPKADVRSGAVTGYEALLRWRHPEFGLLSPGEFVPVLEDTDLIAPVGEWVLREACGQIASWRASGLDVPHVAVNLSARQFRMKGLDATVARIVEEAGIGPGLLELELTESLLMQEPEEAVRTLANLKRYGVRIAVDDFGTGYSSLAYLKRFPIDALKIDRAFVSDATANPDDAAITLAIINLGHSLGLTVVAEGVENEAQLAFLREHGCDEMQGFLFSPPLPAEEIARRTPESPPAAAASLREATA